MLNNILTGWCQAIVKFTFIFTLLCLIVMCIPVLAGAPLVGTESKWFCGASEDLYSELIRYKEEPIMSGSVVDDLFYMSFWANAVTGTWTIIVSSSKEKGTSCMVLEGSKFHLMKPKNFV